MKRLGIVLAGGLCAVAGATPAFATSGITQHGSILLNGGTIACPTATLTATGGQLRSVFHESVDAAGHYHYTGTNTADAITLTDARGNAYRLVGSSHFSGTSTDPDGTDNIIWNNAVEFTVVAARGGSIGRVSVVEHLNSEHEFHADLGACTGYGGPG